MLDKPRDRKPRIAVIFDGEAWFVRRIRVIEHDLDHDEKVYRCDRPINGKYSSLASVEAELAWKFPEIFWNEEEEVGDAKP